MQKNVSYGVKNCKYYTKNDKNVLRFFNTCFCWHTLAPTTSAKNQPLRKGCPSWTWCTPATDTNSKRTSSTTSMNHGEMATWSVECQYLRYSYEQYYDFVDPEHVIRNINEKSDLSKYDLNWLCTPANHSQSFCPPCVWKSPRGFVWLAKEFMASGEFGGGVQDVLNTLVSFLRH